MQHGPKEQLDRGHSLYAGTCVCTALSCTHAKLLATCKPQGDRVRIYFGNIGGRSLLDPVFNVAPLILLNRIHLAIPK